MKIRSITFFLDPSYPLDDKKLSASSNFIQKAVEGFISAGYEVQSKRLATIPFPHLLPKIILAELPGLAVELERTAVEQGFDYTSLGPALPEVPESYAPIPEALAATRTLNFSGLMTTFDGKVSIPAVRMCSQIIKNASTITEDGFVNMRFAALANVPGGSPFLPAAYHQGGEPVFAIATEAADLAVKAFSEAVSLEEARSRLVNSIESQAEAITRVAMEIENQTGIKFGGIDFSLASFPSLELSLGTAMERMGVQSLGDFGSLAAAAILADTIDQAKFRRAGFCGLMLPVLEDATLSRRAAEGSLSVKDLLLYSAVCGTGLDTIPLPGDTRVEQLTAVCLDLASLALRLAKPLTARLMPIPGKKAGELMKFDFEYTANCRVMSVQSSQLGGLLNKEESFRLNRRVDR